MGQNMTAFIPLKIAVLTVSDSRTSANDSAGDYLVAAVTDAGHQLADRALLADNLYQVRSRVSQWIADEGIQVVLVNGGTGFTDQNWVPEAVGVLFDRTVKGFGELFRQLGLLFNQTLAIPTLGYNVTADQPRPETNGQDLG